VRHENNNKKGGKMAYKSEVARCAAEIRKILKEKNIKASVRSEQFSMGNSVDVEIKEIIDPEVYKALQEELAKYKYGHFDGMYDIYENSNLREDIPQTKFLFIKYDWRLQDEALEKLERFVKAKFGTQNPDHEYKRIAGDLLFGRDDFIAWDEVKDLVKEVA
tara:strand:+ start:136 stop:621 length:486 start_codon:yes stop_codon:yes gene_type:complete